MKKTVNLALPNFRQVAETTGAGLLALGRLAKGGEIILLGMEAGRPMKDVRWTWRVSYEFTQLSLIAESVASGTKSRPKKEVQSEMF
jgi:hypothetical protein